MASPSYHYGNYVLEGFDHLSKATEAGLIIFIYIISITAAFLCGKGNKESHQQAGRMLPGLQVAVTWSPRQAPNEWLFQWFRVGTSWLARVHWESGLRALLDSNEPLSAPRHFPKDPQTLWLPRGSVKRASQLEAPGKDSDKKKDRDSTSRLWNLGTGYHNFFLNYSLKISYFWNSQQR